MEVEKEVNVVFLALVDMDIVSPADHSKEDLAQVLLRPLGLLQQHHINPHQYHLKPFQLCLLRIHQGFPSLLLPEHIAI